MNTNSVAQQDQSGIQSDLNRYKQAAELAYQYVKKRTDDQSTENKSPFEEDSKKELT